MAKCEAEVKRLTRRGYQRYPGASGATQINEYEYGQCTRNAVKTIKMYPPRSSDDHGMHPILGQACKQHADIWLPRKYDAKG